MLGVMGCVACGGGTGTTQTPGTDPGTGAAKRQAAVSEATNTNCDTYARCEQIGPGKDYPTQQDCLTSRSSFWNDRWPSASCDGKINNAQVQTCLDGLQTISCNSLIDELKVINTQCAQADICSGS